uniref:Uncharacterized protein n=1 Tax=Rangifer tarandus platyrhynchus TaxID=3082113 RepID=A0ACB0DY94_RANTA|nr:unnamed protein product [Rangifer tarandus platyrhynchus]
MAAMGPVSSSCFWQDGQGGPGEAEGQPRGVWGWGPSFPPACRVHPQASTFAVILAASLAPLTTFSACG